MRHLLGFAAMVALALTGSKSKPQPRRDSLFAAQPTGLTWALVQTSPRFEMLAVSEDRNRLIEEMRDLVELVSMGGMEGQRHFVVKPANVFA